MLISGLMKGMHMKQALKETSHGPMFGMSRSALEQADVNLSEALRVLDMLPISTLDLCPHPLIVARSEINNARRYITLVGKLP